MKTITFTVLFVVVLAVNSAAGFCVKGLCRTSCKLQNCGTGSCVKRGGRPTCVCSRCGSGGGSWPSV
uniref:Secreted protein n=1 Tax=Parascaris univalens TaxID=6257 RepID=A0A915CG35_PARUN